MNDVTRIDSSTAFICASCRLPNFVDRSGPFLRVKQHDQDDGIRLKRLFFANSQSVQRESASGLSTIDLCYYL